MSNKLLIFVLLLGISVVQSSSHSKTPEDEETCHRLLESHTDLCSMQLENNLSSRREDDPSQFDCCIVARFESCMLDGLPTSCSHDAKKSVKSILKEAKVTIGCERINYPSIYCYAYFYREFVGIVIITMLITFTCYIVMVCCRGCFNQMTRSNPRVIIAMRPMAPMETKPLILVTEHC